MADIDERREYDEPEQYQVVKCGFCNGPMKPDGEDWWKCPRCGFEMLIKPRHPESTMNGNSVTACYQVEGISMSVMQEKIRQQFQQFDRKVLEMYASDPKLTNAKLAERLGCGYDEIVRSLRRSRVVRKVGRQAGARRGSVG